MTRRGTAGATLDDDMLSELRRGFDGLSQSQKRIAELIVNDPEFVAFATVEKVGARLDLSPSTIVRFAYKLGLDGYQDLQERVCQILREQIRNARTDPSSPARHLGDSPYGDSFERDLENLRRTVAGLSVAAIDRAVERILEADHLYVVGGMASDSVAACASLALDRIRGRTVRLRASGPMVMRLAGVTDHDAVVAFSFPPYSTATLRVVEHARQIGAGTIGITDSPISPIGQRVDVVLTAHVSGIGLQNSLVGPIAIVNALVNAMTVRLPGAAQRHRVVMGLMNDWNHFVLKEEEADRE